MITTCVTRPNVRWDDRALLRFGAEPTLASHVGKDKELFIFASNDAVASAPAPGPPGLRRTQPAAAAGGPGARRVHRVRADRDPRPEPAARFAAPEAAERRRAARAVPGAALGLPPRAGATARARSSRARCSGSLDRDDPLVALDRERAIACWRRARVGRPAAAIARGRRRAASIDGPRSSSSWRSSATVATTRCSTPVPRRPRCCAPSARGRAAPSASASRGTRCRGRAASLHGNGLSHCVLQHGDLPGAAPAAASFDAVVLDRVLGTDARRDEWLRESARVLRPGGRLLIVEEYEALSERAARRQPARDAARLDRARRGSSASGCGPSDAARVHVLLAHGVARAGRAGRVTAASNEESTMEASALRDGIESAAARLQAARARVVRVLSARTTRRWSARCGRRSSGSRRSRRASCR